MNRKALTSALVAAAALLAMACKDALDIGSFSVTGTWAGTAKKQVSGTDSATYTFQMELKQDQRSIDGTAVVTVGTESVTTDVDGVWNYPQVSLQFKADEFATLQFNGTFTPEANRDTLAGPLVGSGLDGVTLKLVRQTQ